MFILDLDCGISEVLVMILLNYIWFVNLLATKLDFMVR